MLVFSEVIFASKYARPSVRLRSWTTAMMCSVRLIRRLPDTEEPMMLLVTGGRVRRGGPVPGSEPVTVGEAADVTDVGEPPGRA
ncbi:hypothetical protein Pen02_26610 [Plantactinospora endophytica]|uniref:Uncharacterized protein n=1 Tax=Plantactinospora endophytica TaxID=673535 RepID=A0ABQ4DZ46_9ACTN|nr:hypothetical protein Pen02_26610 [Plantactinospora endophytica]